MSAEIENNETGLQVMATSQEKVLIKRQVLNAEKYEKNILQYAKKKTADLYQQTQENKAHLYKIAYQQGYNDGVKQLLHDFIAGLEHSKIAFQEQVNQSQVRLENLLMSLFNDDRLKDIIAHYFAHSPEIASKTTLHLPAQIHANLNDIKQNITILPHSDYESIALEANNQICYFSPSIATKNTLPQIFSIPARCQILDEQKMAYQKLIDRINIEKDNNEDTPQ
ncbi:MULTISPECIES: hypothetical protein [Providencia]|jgi:hypothetical protein|uniref:hypothetical protein n=1 Tax=Providencia TaxID=586 RepID=UPI002362537E|nr:hypothetical protein [Providencia rettgeri]ELR5150718.1 hypothetical protein [Providencia rettgeri]MDR2227682.1 hypothetical protein [Providencia sp.]